MSALPQLDPVGLAEYWRGESLRHKADAEMLRTLLAISNRTVASQKCEYGKAIDTAYAREREITRRIEAAAALDLHPEWIVTGDAKYPTLRHMIETAYGDWAGDTEVQRSALRQRIAEIRLSYLTTGGPRVVLECFRCGRAKAACDCCVLHRCAELIPERCADCARMEAER